MNLNKYIFIIIASLIAAPAHAAKKKEEVVEMSGISIIGNRELPKTLFIVPWKNSEVGIETELTNTLNEGMQPLDREVFERELDYYEFSKPQ
jgi:hypothetical protein